jgi:hypothetical protein
MFSRVCHNKRCLSVLERHRQLPCIRDYINWMYGHQIPVRDNVAARTPQEKFGFPRCSIVHACDNYPVHLADNVGHGDPNQWNRGDWGRCRGWKAFLALYLGITMDSSGTPLFLRVLPIANSSDYVDKISKRQDYSDDLTKAPRVFARLDD